jgi:hypothetical protein
MSTLKDARVTTRSDRLARSCESLPPFDSIRTVVQNSLQSEL